MRGGRAGYAASGEGCERKELVRRHPWSVGLLVWLEETNHDVHELFCRVFEKGGMVDGEGTHVDFKHSTSLPASDVYNDLVSQLSGCPS
ncbi:AAA family ATPase [Salmonella enterica]|uniref:AAA family ATPase n=1 Tax=Salmonella enterica TaxID=28901 RepID=UPI00398C60A2